MAIIISKKGSKKHIIKMEKNQLCLVSGLTYIYNELQLHLVVYNSFRTEYEIKQINLLHYFPVALYFISLY